MYFVFSSFNQSCFLSHGFGWMFFWCFLLWLLFKIDWLKFVIPFCFLCFLPLHHALPHTLTRKQNLFPTHIIWYCTVSEACQHILSHVSLNFVAEFQKMSNLKPRTTSLPIACKRANLNNVYIVFFGSQHIRFLVLSTDNQVWNASIE